MMHHGRRDHCQISCKGHSLQKSNGNRLHHLSLTVGTIESSPIPQYTDARDCGSAKNDAMGPEWEKRYHWRVSEYTRCLYFVVGWKLTLEPDGNAFFIFCFSTQSTVLAHWFAFDQENTNTVNHIWNDPFWTDHAVWKGHFPIGENFFLPLECMRLDSRNWPYDDHHVQPISWIQSHITSLILDKYIVFDHINYP